MNIIRAKWRILLITLYACFIWSHGFAAATTAATPPGSLLVKISRLAETLDVIDGFYPGAEGMPPTSMLRGMLYGTDWIDASRSIVIAFDRQGDQYLVFVLLPYRQPNPNFADAYGAMERSGAYLLQLPPGRPAYVPESLEAAMAQAAQQPGRSTVSVELNVKTLIDSNQDAITAFFNKVDQSVQQPQQPMALSPAEIKDMLQQMLQTAQELETLVFRVDLNREHFSIASQASATKGSRLAELFSPEAENAYLNAYRGDYPIVFKSRAYDVEGVIQLLNACFGRLYEKMGVDFAELTSISRHFTGEVAGGMAFDEKGLQFESIMVLKEDDDAQQFLTGVYLPWILGYGQKMTRLLEEQLQTAIPPLFSRTPDTQIDGRTVVGLRASIPMAQGENAGQLSSGADTLAYEMRTTTRDNLLLVAPDDRRLAKLLQLSRALKKAPASGPFMQVDIDLATYVAAIESMAPGTGRRAALPDLGAIKISTQMAEGTILSETSVRTVDLMRLLAYGMKMPPPQMPPPQPAPAAAQDHEAAVPVDEADPDYWFDKAGLVATYGNDKAAVEYFKKVITLDPQRSDAYFNLGIAYGELGQYQQAIGYIDRAISMAPDKGLYYYGRGRVFLLSGDPEQAHRDFETAAEKGDPDAKAYLKRQ